MNKAIRWRIISLQAMLVIILAGASGFLFYEGNFVTGMVHDQLIAQQIYFPGTDQIKAGGSLDPAEFPAEIRDYAGQQVDNGDKARVYAQDFIGNPPAGRGRRPDLLLDRRQDLGANAAARCHPEDRPQLRDAPGTGGDPRRSEDDALHG